MPSTAGAEGGGCCSSCFFGVGKISPALTERERMRAGEKFQRGFCCLAFSFMPIHADCTLQGYEFETRLLYAQL